MDELNVRMGSAYYSRAAKAAREANQNEFVKVNKVLDKWKSISMKNLGKEEERMKRLMNRLEQDKAKYKSESVVPPELSSPCPSPADNLSPRKSFLVSHAKSSTNSPEVDVKGKLFDYELTQGRSRRQLSVSPLKDSDIGRLTPDDHAKGFRRYSLGDPLHPRSVMSLKPGGTDGVQDRTKSSVAVDKDNYDNARRYSTPAGGSSIYLAPPLYPPCQKKTSESRIASASKKSLKFEDSVARDKSAHTIAMSPVSTIGLHSESKARSPTPKLPGSNESLKYSNVSIRLGKSAMTKELRRSTEALKNIYDMTIKSVANADSGSFAKKSNADMNRRKSKADSMVGSKTSIGRMSGTKLKSDHRILKDLEELLKDAKQYTNKKTRQVNMMSDHSMRYNKKRIQYLENILSSLKSNEREPYEFDPASILRCKYLRLSDSNIEHLENELRKVGVEPGIHCHSKNYSLGLFDDQDEDKIVSTVLVET